MTPRVYICHTFYHAYIACVKELLLRHGLGKIPPAADLILSTMSNDFGEMPKRLKKTELFREILFFEEQSGADDPELQELRRDRGNLPANLLQRVKYTKLLGKKQEPHVPADLRTYQDVYVFCDSDPIGYYLNWKKIRYHALEDGLNCDKLDDMARLSNQGAFRLKALLARLGLIFIPNGYSRYCTDYEVNDLSVNPLFPKNVSAVPRRELYAQLTAGDHALLAEVFLPDAQGLRDLMNARKRPVAMILTEPLCELRVREKLFDDIVEEYRTDYDIIIKPHPRDLLDYETLYSGEKGEGVFVLTGRFPMEALDDLKGFRIARLISVITQVDNAGFADEIVYLGLDFLDRYEDPAVHRKMENFLSGQNRAQAAAGGQATGLMIRPAAEDDCDWWLEVRNDPETRRNSGSTGEIDPETHRKWFAEKLADPQERLYICMKDGERAGQLRLSGQEPEVEISYAVAPKMRGQGVGRGLLEAAKDFSAKDFPGRTLFGTVREENAASLHLFGSCGFTENGCSDGMVRFVRKGTDS